MSGLDIIRREEWQDPSMPVVGPGILLHELELMPAHYTAASDVPDNDVPAYLRAIQRDYTVNRGYSIGYNFAIDKAALVYELRGIDIKCAANKDMNDVTVAVLCLVDGADAMSPGMVAAFREVGTYVRDLLDRELLVVGHRDIGSTACPGDGIYSQVVAGELDIDAAPAPVPLPPVPPEEGDDVSTFIMRNRDSGEVVLLAYDGAGVTATGLAFEDLDGYTGRFGPWLDTNPDVFADLIRKSNEQ